MREIIWEIGKEESPWDEDDIDEFVNSMKQSAQKASDELHGRGVKDMRPSDILTDGMIIGESGENEFIVSYRGEKFTVSVDHPEL